MRWKAEKRIEYIVERPAVKSKLIDKINAVSAG